MHDPIAEIAEFANGNISTAGKGIGAAPRAAAKVLAECGAGQPRSGLL